MKIKIGHFLVMATYLGLITIIFISLVILSSRTKNINENAATIKAASIRQKINSNKRAPEQKEIFNYENATRIDLAKDKIVNKNIMYSAYLKVPSLSISVPITEGVNYLNVSAGTLKPNQRIGEENYAVLAHNLFNDSNRDLLFSNLYKAKIGEKINLFDDAKYATYQIYQVKEISSKDVNVIENSTDRNNIPIITMITCTPNHEKTKRLMIRGVLINLVDTNNRQ